ncbi:hypothetical protein DEO72_LG3g1015 [Vigna unguiculata]|uniref:Uncharacterized protein n=1 Tax=Vigna unguiculata TaxID=3917 RepID=A0A4D6LD30_VIGUN|nr:hypothetical protein DEO72_LG3g1015 [Vigna unguiculata]
MQHHYCSLFELLPRRRELALARERSRLSETLLPEQEAGRECTRWHGIGMSGNYIFMDWEE